MSAGPGQGLETTVGPAQPEYRMLRLIAFPTVTTFFPPDGCIVFSA